MKVGQKVLLVEDDEALSQSLREQLELHEEFAISAVESGAEGLQAIKTEHFDLIILDIGLPDMNGRDVCKVMRRSGITSPIIMLTGSESEADTILGLDSGCVLGASWASGTTTRRLSRKPCMPKSEPRSGIIAEVACCEPTRSRCTPFAVDLPDRVPPRKFMKWCARISGVSV